MIPEFLEYLLPLLAGTLLYAGTNLDNVAVLMVYLAGQQALGRAGPRLAALALGLAAVVVLGVSLLIADLLSDAALLPAHWLGLVPIALGLKGLFWPGAPDAARAGRMPVLAMSLLVLANSADTLAALAPVLTESHTVARSGLVVGYALAVILFAIGLWGVGRRITTLPGLVAVARWAGPLIMIAVGTYILLDTPTDLI